MLASVFSVQTLQIYRPVSVEAQVSSQTIKKLEADLGAATTKVVVQQAVEGLGEDAAEKVLGAVAGNGPAMELVVGLYTEWGADTFGVLKAIADKTGVDGLLGLVVALVHHLVSCKCFCLGRDPQILAICGRSPTFFLLIQLGKAPPKALSDFIIQVGVTYF